MNLKLNEIQKKYLLELVKHDISQYNLLDLDISEEQIKDILYKLNIEV